MGKKANIRKVCLCIAHAKVYFLEISELYLMEFLLKLKAW